MTTATVLILLHGFKVIVVGSQGLTLYLPTVAAHNGVPEHRYEYADDNGRKDLQNGIPNWGNLVGGGTNMHITGGRDFVVQEKAGWTPPPGKIKYTIPLNIPKSVTPVYQESGGSTYISGSGVSHPTSLYRIYALEYDLPGSTGCHIYHVYDELDQTLIQNQPTTHHMDLHNIVLSLFAPLQINQAMDPGSTASNSGAVKVNANCTIQTTDMNSLRLPFALHALKTPANDRARSGRGKKDGGTGGSDPSNCEYGFWVCDGSDPNNCSN